MRPSEVREYTNEELRERVAELKEERFRLRFQGSLMEIENPALLGTLRKDIARIMTVLNEREREGGAEAAADSGSEEA